jgi:hypothetical protein
MSTVQSITKVPAPIQKTLGEQVKHFFLPPTDTWEKASWETVADTGKGLLNGFTGTGLVLLAPFLGPLAGVSLGLGLGAQAGGSLIALRSLYHAAKAAILKRGSILP